MISRLQRSLSGTATSLRTDSIWPLLFSSREDGLRNSSTRCKSVILQEAYAPPAAGEFAQRLRRMNAQFAVTSESVAFPELLRALRLRELLKERTMFARSGATIDLSAEVVGFKGERHRPSYGFGDAF